MSGFGDADPDNIYKNKLLIANLMKEPLHAVILLMTNRFAKPEQRKIFYYLFFRIFFRFHNFLLYKWH